jgi:hypothetical protein
MISVLVLIWAVVVGLDAATTREGLDRWLKEANPILRWLMDKMGEAGLWVGAMAFGAVIVACIVGLYEWHPWAGYALGAFAIVWRGRVVINNIRLIRGRK